MRALSLDTLAGEASLLVDDAATKSAIEGALEALSKCSPDHDVVIAFSGHGTDNHQLICYDTRIDDPRRDFHSS